MLQPCLGFSRSVDNVHRQYANQAAETIQGKGSEASKEANKSMPPCVVESSIEANISIQTLQRTAMLPLALVPQPPRTPWETSSMSRSMRCVLNDPSAAINVLRQVPDQGRCPQRGSKELSFAPNELDIEHYE